MKNGEATLFHPIMNHYNQIHNDWSELIYLSTKYKIIDIKKDILKQFKDKNGITKYINYNIITIE